MTSPFAGRRRNGDLGRSVDVRGGLFLHGRTHRRQWVPLGRRGGERRQRAFSITRTRREGTACRSRLTGDTSFTRSKDPCTSNVAQLSPRDPQGRLGFRRKPAGQLEEATRRGSHRGRANPGNWEEPAPRLVTSGGARLAARHRPARESRSDVSEKEGGRGLRPCEDLESSGLSARTS